MESQNSEPSATTEDNRNDVPKDKSEAVNTLTQQVSTLISQKSELSKLYNDEKEKWQNESNQLSKRNADLFKISSESHQSLMNARNENSTLQDKLREVQEELAQLRKSNLSERQEADKKDSAAQRTLQEAQKRETEERSRADGLKSAFTAVFALDGIVDDIARLHLASASAEVSRGLQTIVIPRVQFTTDSLREPTYSAAFELWLSAQRGALDLECASSFLEQLVSDPTQTQGAFLPWIHGATQKAAAIFASRNADPPTWTFTMLKEAVIIMQLLAYVYSVSPQHQWEPSLKDNLSVISDSVTHLPRSMVFSEMYAQVQRLIERGQYMVSWIDFTLPISTAQLDSSNSLLAIGDYLVLDVTADALVFVTGTPRTIHLLSHEDIEMLDIYVFVVVLKLLSPVKALHLQTKESQRFMGRSVIDLIFHPWFEGHRRRVPLVFDTDGRRLEYGELS